MTTKTISNKALEIAALTKSIKDDGAKLAPLKLDLIRLVGSEGEKIVNALGTVTVTKQTEDRSSGKVSYSLDLDTFLELDESIQANLIKKGVVKKTAGMIKGQAPCVKVSLKD